METFPFEIIYDFSQNSAQCLQRSEADLKESKVI